MIDCFFLQKTVNENIELQVQVCFIFLVFGFWFVIFVFSLLSLLLLLLREWKVLNTHNPVTVDKRFNHSQTSISAKRTECPRGISTNSIYKTTWIERSMKDKPKTNRAFSRPHLQFCNCLSLNRQQAKSHLNQDVLSIDN